MALRFPGLLVAEWLGVAYSKLGDSPHEWNERRDAFRPWSGCGSNLGQFLDDPGQTDGVVVEAPIVRMRFVHGGESLAFIRQSRIRFACRLV